MKREVNEVPSGLKGALKVMLLAAELKVAKVADFGGDWLKLIFVFVVLVVVPSENVGAKINGALASVSREAFPSPKLANAEALSLFNGVLGGAVGTEPNKPFGMVFSCRLSSFRGVTWNEVICGFDTATWVTFLVVK